MGLPIAKAIVTAHGGLDFGDQPAQFGVGVFVHLAGRVAERGSMNSASILVVDDEPQIRRVPCVPRWRFVATSFVEAASGEEAVELAQKVKPDLILLDVNCRGCRASRLAGKCGDSRRRRSSC